MIAFRHLDRGCRGTLVRLAHCITCEYPEGKGRNPRCLIFTKGEPPIVLPFGEQTVATHSTIVWCLIPSKSNLISRLSHIARPKVQRLHMRRRGSKLGHDPDFYFNCTHGGERSILDLYFTAWKDPTWHVTHLFSRWILSRVETRKESMAIRL